MYYIYIIGRFLKKILIFLFVSYIMNKKFCIIKVCVIKRVLVY